MSGHRAPARGVCGCRVGSGSATAVADGTRREGMDRVVSGLEILAQASGVCWESEAQTGVKGRLRCAPLDGIRPGQDAPFARKATGAVFPFRACTPPLFRIPPPTRPLLSLSLRVVVFCRPASTSSADTGGCLDRLLLGCSPSPGCSSSRIGDPRWRLPVRPPHPSQRRAPA